MRSLARLRLAQPFRARANLWSQSGPQAGFAIVEIIVSSLILIVVAIGAFTALDASGRAGAEERHRAQASAVATDDQARLRSLSISDLVDLDETRTTTVDGTPYSVTSRGEFVNDTGSATCEPGTATIDYTQISSTVTWPSMGSRPPVAIESIVAPPSGSIPGRGALLVEAINPQGVGISGLALSGSGAGSFSGSTGSTGCARFKSLPAGNYTLTPSGPGLVDANGNAPTPLPISVVDGSTNTIVLQYGQPGSIVTTFTSKGYGSTFATVKADSVMVFNSGMSAAKAVPSPGGVPATPITAGSLYPFTSAYTVYSGTCTGDNPATSSPPGTAALKSVTVPAGGSVGAAIQLPALKATVYRGTSTSTARASGVTMWVRDRNCANFKRTYTTNTNGQLVNLATGEFLGALPYSSYDICVKGTNTTGATRWIRRNPWALNTSAVIATPPVLSLFLGSGTTSNPDTAACPP